jgi:MFS family permease
VNRDFRLLWIGQALSGLGAEVSSVAYPLLVLATTGSAAKAGLVALVAGAPFVLLQLPAGAYVDRWNRRAVMLAADLGRAVALGAVAFGHLPFAGLLVVAAVEGSLFVLFRLAEGAALRQVVDEARLPSAIALNQARGYGASLAGQPLGGWLFGVGSMLPFAADAVSYLASLATVASIRTPLPAPPPVAGRHLAREIADGLRAAWHNRFLRTTALLTTGSDFVINGLFLVFVVVAAGHGASPAEVGLMLALGGAGGMLGALAAPALARRVTSTRLVVAGAVWVGVPLIALASLTTRPVLLGALLGLVLSVWPLYNAVVTARWMAQVPDALMGRVQSAVALLGWAPVPLAPWIGGLLTEHVGGAATVLAFAVLMLAIAVAATVVRHDDPMDRRHIELAQTLKDLGLWRGLTPAEAAAEQKRVAAGGWPFKLQGDEPGETWFFIDSEEMAEGFAPRELAALAPALRAYGIELQVDVVARPVHVEDGEHVISINGRPCVMWSPEDWEGYRAWETATLRPLAVLNDLLAEAGATERLFSLVNSGNDGIALLLDPRIVAAVEASGLHGGLPRRPG